MSPTTMATTPMMIPSTFPTTITSFDQSVSEEKLSDEREEVKV
jgi:hypothetical protein